MTLNLGPLALPLAPALLLAAVLLTSWAVRRVSEPEEREATDAALWWALAAGLLAARVAHLLSHLSTYAAGASVLDLLDIRDGGFWALPGIAVGLGVLAWRLRPAPASRSAVMATVAVGLALWWLAGVAIKIARPTPGQTLAEIAVVLQPVMATHAPTPTPTPTQAPAPAPTLAPTTLQSLAAQPAPRVLVLNLWATWCGPCRAEMPMLAQAQREHPDVLFVFANQGEGEAAIHAYLQRERLDLASVWRDPTSALGPAVGSGGLPTTVVFDAQGRRVAEHMGALNRAGLEVMLRRAQGPR